ncbi:unnamed protein product [Prorocentrum cordatum]|uniref:Uncharacterized protein n=1 Tax=Prorocentrum cordatum TaxID=2364126 RepID=A0ABN9UBL3_9DINO|nr:unnamed protein product [Polarella glacialis]
MTTVSVTSTSMTATSRTATSTMSTSTITTSTGTTTSITSITSVTTLSTSSSTESSTTTLTNTNTITASSMTSPTTGHTTTFATMSTTSTTSVTASSMTSTTTGHTTSMSSTTTLTTATASSSTAPTTATASSSTTRTSSTASSSTTPTTTTETFTATGTTTTKTYSETGTTTSETYSTTSSSSTTAPLTSQASSSTLHSTTTTGTTTATATATPQRWSEVRGTLVLTFGTNVSSADAAAAAQSAISLYLDMSESLVTADSVTVSQAGTSGSRRGARALSSITFSYAVAYIVAVAGSDASREQTLLAALHNDTSVIASTLQAVLEEMGLPSVTSLLATEPEVLVWFLTTATQTSTAGMACYADSVPDAWDVIDSSSCVGTASGSSCSPVCNESYELIEPIKCTNGQFDELPLICIHSRHAEALELTDVFVVEMAIATNESDSGLTADWARSAGIEAAIKSTLAKLLGLLQGQIFLKGQEELSPGWAPATPTRRLASLHGLSFEAVLQPYPIDSLTDLEDGLLGLGVGDFIGELQAALEAAGSGAPPGLSTATLLAGAPTSARFTLPVARWVARTPWSTCSNTCGAGERTRTVDCVGAWGSDAVELCSASAAPGASGVASSEACEQYVGCPCDWSCPSGPDPVTCEGCEAQASRVAIAIVVTFVFCACLLGWLVRRRRYPSSRGSNLHWTRDEGIVDGDADTRKKGQVPGCATLTPRGGQGAPVGPVDLDFGGTVDFELQIGVRTTAQDSLLVGRLPRRGGAARGGGAKALVIRQGLAAWQVGEDCISGKTYLADGEKHVISVSYSRKEDQYVPKVDGQEDARGLHRVADHPGDSLVLGTASAPRNGVSNAISPLLEKLRSAGVKVSPVEGNAEQPLFDGDVDCLTWREQQKKHGRMVWMTYDLNIETEDAVAERITTQIGDNGSKTVTFDTGSATSTTLQLCHKGQSVEYWSESKQTWLPAKILCVNGTHYDKALKVNAFSYEVQLGGTGQTVQNVDVRDLRMPLVEGESVSVFSQKFGGWFPARVHGSRHGGHSGLVHDVRLESAFDEHEELQAYVMSELQADLERFAGPATQGGVLPALRDIPSKLLRRRYDRGVRVRLYRNPDVGFVEAEVVGEEEGAGPEAEAEGIDATQGTSSVPKRFSAADQRYATVLVRRVGAGGGSQGDGGLFGADGLEEVMKVPDYVLRHPTADDASVGDTTWSI